MSDCPEALWRQWFGQRPMPQGLTYYEFADMRDELWIDEDLVWLGKWLARLQKIIENSVGAKKEMIQEYYDDQLENFGYLPDLRRFVR